MSRNFNHVRSMGVALAAAVMAANAVAGDGQGSNSPGLDAVMWILGWLFR